MHWYIGFNDPDTLDSEIGTGRYARYFALSAFGSRTCVNGVSSQWPCAERGRAPLTNKWS